MRSAASMRSAAADVERSMDALGASSWIVGPGADRETRDRRPVRPAVRVRLPRSEGSREVDGPIAQRTAGGGADEGGAAGGARRTVAMVPVATNAWWLTRPAVRIQRKKPPIESRSLITI